jgi:hypothetical protein
LLNPDYRDMLSALNDAGAEYLVVGAFAMAAHGFPRATGDIDILVRPGSANAERVWRALAEFGAPLQGFKTADLEAPGVVFQIGVAPRRIDILSDLSGLGFEEAWRGRREVEVEGLKVPFLGRAELIKNKRATGRPKDLLDVQWLEQGQA